MKLNFIDSLTCKMLKFYKNNREHFFEKYNTEIARLFIREMKKEYALNLADEFVIAQKLAYMLQKDIQNMNKFDKLEKKSKNQAKKIKNLKILIEKS